jgi:hypothetical protein
MLSVKAVVVQCRVGLMRALEVPRKLFGAAP